MRKVVLIVGVLVLLVLKIDAQNSFTVSGTLKNSPSKVVYLEEDEAATGKKTLKDSSQISADGKFSVKTTAATESLYELRLKNDVPPFVTLINDANNIVIDADFNQKFNFYNVTGSKASKAIQDYFSRLSEIQREKINIYYQVDSLKKNNADNQRIENLNTRQKEINKEFKIYTEQVVHESGSAPFSLFILGTYQGMANDQNYRIDGFSGEQMLGLIDDMIKKFPGRGDLAGIRTSIESQIPKTGWVGKQAPELSLPDTEGKIVTLSSFRGKYVLVDFWASWCGPCRRENPNVVDAYNQYKGKNFTVLGVSLDRPGQKDSWLGAIHHDGLTWTHVSDLKFWDNEVAKEYGIKAIPQNLLLDPDGKIIAKNLRGDELDAKLGEVMADKKGF